MITLKQLAAAVSALVIITSTAWGSSSLTIGRVYDIVEQDALEEIKAKAEQTDWKKAMSKPRSEWSAYRYAPVTAAVENLKREYVPYHTVEHPVHSASGELIYPVGYQFNPLDYVTMPRRLVVIRPEHGEWASSNIKATDLVLLSGSDNEKLSKRLERPVFILDKRTRDRLDVRVAPSVIEQSGSVFIITEHAVEEDHAAK